MPTFTIDNTPAAGATLSGVGTITNPTTITGVSTGMAINNASSLNGDAFAGFRNRIRNGNMQIQQRAGTSTVSISAVIPTATSGYKNVDGWYSYATFAAGTTAIVAATTNSQAKRLQFTGASTAMITWGQRIESKDCQDLAGKTVTLSFKCASNSGAAIVVGMRYANTVNAFGNPTSPTYTELSGYSPTPSASEQTFSYTQTLPAISGAANVTNGIEVYFSMNLGVGQTVTMGDVQLEVGSVATPFEIRPYIVDFVMCLRYYQELYVGWYGAGVASGACGSPTVLPVNMRTTPTISAITNDVVANTNCAAGAASQSTVNSQVVHMYKNATATAQTQWLNLISAVCEIP